MDEIADCPWCSDVAELHNYDRMAQVECVGCGARGPQIVNDDAEVSQNNAEAVRRWNDVAKEHA